VHRCSLGGDSTESGPPCKSRLAPGRTIIAAPDLSLSGRAGAFRAEITTDTTISGDTRFADSTEGSFRSVSQDETVLEAGLGAGYAFTRNLAARLEWERYFDVGKRATPESRGNTGEADHDAWWPGVVFRF
jgi:opacity protein-like surface antigen